VCWSMADAWMPRLLKRRWAEVALVVAVEVRNSIATSSISQRLIVSTMVSWVTSLMSVTSWERWIKQWCSLPLQMQMWIPHCFEAQQVQIIATILGVLVRINLVVRVHVCISCVCAQCAAWCGD
jgi:hypothetical protein